MKTILCRKIEGGFVEMYQRIRDLREDNDLRQSDVADKIFMQREQYRRYETGQREVPLNVAVLLADLYDVSLDYLAGRSNRKERLK